MIVYKLQESFIILIELAANFSSIDLDLHDLARSIKCNHYSYRNHTSSTDTTIP